MKRVYIVIAIVIALSAIIGLAGFFLITNNNEAELGPQDKVEVPVTKLSTNGKVYLVKTNRDSNEYLSWLQEYSNGSSEYKSLYLIDSNNTVYPYYIYLNSQNTESGGIATAQVNDTKDIPLSEVVSVYELEESNPKKIELDRIINEIESKEWNSVARQLVGDY